MAQEKPAEGVLINIDALPKQFPSHRHDASFWESLGRTVATFGFLEEILGKAIFSFVVTRPIDASKLDAESEKWLAEKLEKALTDPLGRLIKEYKKAVQVHPQAMAIREGFDDLITKLRTASVYMVFPP